MNEIAHYYTRQPPHHGNDHNGLRAEIAFLEARLRAIGGTGDCAYERALARSYRSLLEARREELAQRR